MHAPYTTHAPHIHHTCTMYVTCMHHTCNISGATEELVVPNKVSDDSAVAKLWSTQPIEQWELDSIEAKYKRLYSDLTEVRFRC